MAFNFKRSAALAGAVAVASVGLVACQEEGSTSAAGGANNAAAVEGLSGATGQLVAEGASSQQNAMDYFGTKYSAAVSGATLAYNASGSGSGRQNFIGKQVAFAGSDSPLKDDQVGPAQDRCGGAEAWHLPFVIGPVAIAYNLSGVEDLNLSVETIAKIFKGEITTWNDAAIAAENAGVELPDTKISVVYRSDESGTSDNFQKFLKSAVPDQWETTGQQFPQAVGAGANGSNGVATETSNIDGAITYVESGFAQQNGLGIVNIDFGSGPVKLSPESVGVALDNLTFKGEGHNMVVDSGALFAMTESGAYPLVLTTYEIVCSDYTNSGDAPETADLVKDFLTVALNHQDDQLAQLGYIPVTGTHAQRLEEAVAAIK